MTAPRRWSFGLRTMLLGVALLAVPGAWAGYQLRWIRERHKVIDQKLAEWMMVFPDDDFSDMPQPPWSLRLFGEEQVGDLLNGYDLTEGEANRIRSLFPEMPFTNLHRQALSPVNRSSAEPSPPPGHRPTH